MTMKSVLLMVCLYSLAVTSVRAEGFDTRIERAELIVQQQHYVLNAELSFQLSPVANSALHHGIPLSFEVLLKIERDIYGLWLKTLKEISIRYQVRYLTLLNIYRLDNDKGKEIGHYSTLSGALKDLGDIQNIYVAGSGELPENEMLIVTLQVDLDREALPLPLRVESYFKAGWSLASKPYFWSVVLKQQDPS